MDAATLLSQVNGLPISHAWRGYGSALFLELGKLTQTTQLRRDGSQRNPTGQVSVCLYEGWLISADQKPIYTAEVDESLSTDLLAFCVSRSVEKIEVATDRSELRMMLSGQMEIEACSRGDRSADWAIAFQCTVPPQWLYLKQGEVRMDDGSPDQ